MHARWLFTLYLASGEWLKKLGMPTAAHAASTVVWSSWIVVKGNSLRNELEVAYAPREVGAFALGLHHYRM